MKCAERLTRSRVRSRRASDRKSTRLNSSHQIISYAVFCLKKKKTAIGSHNATPFAVPASKNLSPATETTLPIDDHLIASKSIVYWISASYQTCHRDLADAD